LFAALVLNAPLAPAQTAPVSQAAPEAATGFAARPAVNAKRFMAATANRHATNAAFEILKIGGSAIDAAIAAQLVLGLTEPQSSGLGGGAFILHFDVRTRKVRSYDGRETAPAAAKTDRFIGADGKLLSYPAAVGSGLSVGVPGALRVMELAHKQHGKLPWARLFSPAVNIAQSGFALSPRLHSLIARDPLLRNDAAALAYFYESDGKALPVGALMRNPDYAATLRIVAREGASAFYRGDIARDIIAAVQRHTRPGDMTEADLVSYLAKEREPVCGIYRGKRICGMPPPSAGGIAVLAMLGMLERFDIAALRPDSTQAVHLFSEAGRLAFADRDHYVADPDTVRVPMQGLIDLAYLKSRSALINPERSMGRAAHGAPPGVTAAFGADATIEAAGTSHLSIVDADGNAVAMTTTIESAFGARIMVRGFLLNNQLTDFSWIESGGGPGNPAAANAVAGGKRPRSAMAPTFVFNEAGKLEFVVGSPGGPPIINYVAKSLVGLIDWKLGLAETFAQPHYGSRNRATEIEKGTRIESLILPLRAMGHEVSIGEFASGYTGIAVTKDGLSGAADPRREGTARGE
jgi:gamma-glutamyltranspeptidase/glutathione hydrolase